MALEFSLLIRSLLGTTILGFNRICSFLPSCSKFYLPIVVIPSLSGSSNCMGVMRNDVEGLEHDDRAQRK